MHGNDSRSNGKWADKLRKSRRYGRERSSAAEAAIQDKSIFDTAEPVALSKTDFPRGLLDRILRACLAVSRSFALVSIGCQVYDHSAQQDRGAEAGQQKDGTPVGFYGFDQRQSIGG